MRISYSGELIRARRRNIILSDERPVIIRQREERLRLRQGVSSFRLHRDYRCGEAADLVMAQLLLQIDGDRLTKAQRQFRVSSLFHLGVLGTQACPACMQIFRLFDLYRTWWREGIILEGWERVPCLDPNRLWSWEIVTIAEVIRRRLAFMAAVEQRYDSVTGKLQY